MLLMTDPDTRQNTAPQTTDRDALRVRFAAAHLGEGPALQAMPADASFRRYFRVEGADRPLLVMDAPPSHENLPAYLRIARYLHEHGFAAPEVLASDVEQGFALIEDFGDSTYTRLLAAEADEAALYRLAVEVLAGLHAAPPPATGREGFAAYDMASLLDEAALFPDWYWEHITGSAATPWQRQRFLGLMHEAVGITAGRRETLVLRDYHIDNLMLRPGQPQGAVASCGLLDFQDGLVGARA
jgi:N-acetylmuramate 1-kinase